VIGAVAMAMPSSAYMIATPVMVGAVPPGRNPHATQPTIAVMINMKNPMPFPSSRTIVVHTVRNDVRTATPTPTPTRKARLALRRPVPAVSFAAVMPFLPPEYHPAMTPALLIGLSTA
jgi:hypothetical protein